MLKIINITIFGVFFLLALSACQSAVPATQGVEEPKISLESCHLSAPGSTLRIAAKCGKIKVYEDRQAETGRMIELNLAIIPAVSRNPEPDPVFFLAGGPGEAATESFLLVYAALIQINQKRDIVLLDQRGTGGSNPLSCSEAGLTEPDNSGDAEKIKTFVQNCLAQFEADPRLYTTSIAMDDLDEVRASLGYDQINLYGASYGTRAAQVYALKHKEHVRSMILDGVVPLDWSLGPMAAGDAQRALEMLFARCESDMACNAAFPNLPDEFRAVYESLKTQPVKVTLMHPISGLEVEQEYTLEAFSNTVHIMSYEPETASMLPLMIHQAYLLSDFRPLAAQFLSTTELLSSQISSGMRFSVLCSEDVPFYSSVVFSEGYLENQFQEVFGPICKTWPADTVSAEYKQALQTDIPTLLLSGEADPVTPPANGEQVARSLTHSLHIVAPGQGHIVIFRGCIPQLANIFVEMASLLEIDTACVQNIKPIPFFINFNGPTP
jgi:pimeloyl-ACP methyl ester carboxylesterase